MKQWLAALGLVIAPVLAYFPGLTSRFTHYDDGLYVWNNLERISAPGWDGFLLQWSSARAWSGDFVEYFPLRDSVYWFLTRVFDLNPLPYHLASLLFHIICVFGVFALLAQLGMSRRGAYAGALLFALHPVHIESVVWIAGMKDPMYTMFMVWGIYAYASYRVRPTAWKYTAMLLCLVCSFLVKSLVVAMPVIMLCIDLLFPPRVAWKEVAARLAGPFIITGIFFATIMGIGKANHVIATPHGGTWLSHTVIVFWAQAKYLKQAVMPTSFRLIYCFEPPTGLTDWRLWVGVAVVLGMFSLLWFWRKHPQRVFYVLFYLLALAPVSNLVPFPAIMADRYLYAATVGICALGGMLFDRLPARLFGLTLAAAVVVMTASTAARTWVWQDEELLWEEPDTDPACVLDTSVPAAQSHMLRFLTVKNRTEGLMALERAMASPGFSSERPDLFCSAVSRAAEDAFELGVEERAIHWAKLANKLCPTNARAWNVAMVINLERNPPVAAMAARKTYRLTGMTEAETMMWLTQMSIDNPQAAGQVVRISRLKDPTSCEKILNWAVDRPKHAPALGEAVANCQDVPPPTVHALPWLQDKVLMNPP